MMQNASKTEGLPAVETRSHSDLEPGFVVVVWNDPVNLMSYVTHVFMRLFGWPKSKADIHMLEVHHQGKSVLVQTGREKAELYVGQLQNYGLTATMESVGE